MMLSGSCRVSEDSLLKLTLVMWVPVFWTHTSTRALLPAGTLVASSNSILLFLQASKSLGMFTSMLTESRHAASKTESGF